MQQTLIDCDSLRAMMRSEHCVVVDCRFELSDFRAGERAYLEGHVPGARYADLERDLSGAKHAGSGRHPLPSPAALCGLFARLGIARGLQVVAYDAAGGMLAAARFWWLLRYVGHESVAVLDGGWKAWSVSGGAIEAGPQAEANRTDFEAQPPGDLVVTIDQITLPADNFIDSRDPARYRGEVEPIDPVAGHIPGASNYPCMQNLDESGRFYPRERIGRNMAAAAPAVARGDAVFYCGSGVTACHNILAAVHAGFPEPRLYAGSWSEWCADSDRPVDLG